MYKIYTNGPTPKVVIHKATCTVRHKYNETKNGFWINDLEDDQTALAEAQKLEKELNRPIKLCKKCG